MKQKSNTLYPGSYQIPAMSYTESPVNQTLLKELKSKKYIGQEKIDGIWYMLEVTDSKDIYLFSKTISKMTGELSERIDNVPHIKKWAKSLPSGTILIGDIHIPGKSSNETAKIMDALSANKDAHYYLFDMIRYDKNFLLDKDYEHRYSDLCEYIDFTKENPSFINIAKSFTGFDMYDSIQRYLSNGAKGCVIKLKTGLYLPGECPHYNFNIEKID